jgi:hypothetical protein
MLLERVRLAKPAIDDEAVGGEEDRLLVVEEEDEEEEAAAAEEDDCWMRGRAVYSRFWNVFIVGPDAADILYCASLVLF